MAEYEDDDTDNRNEPPVEAQMIEASSLAVLTQAEMNTAVDIAKRYERNLVKVKKNVLQLAAADKETAEGCFFSLPRKKKNEQTGKMEDVEIEGESIRLAEIVVSAWGNIPLWYQNHKY
jgi:hypothetical protein